MSIEYGSRQYHLSSVEARISGASPTQLMLVLFDALLDELARSRAHIENRRYEPKGESLGKCIALVSGMKNSLNISEDNETMNRMIRLHDYCVWRLVEAGHDMDVEKVEEVRRLFATLREGWAGAQV